jgi:hypothetical protein
VGAVAALVGVSTVFFYFNSKTKTNVWLSCPQFGKSFAVFGGAMGGKNTPRNTHKSEHFSPPE